MLKMSKSMQSVINNPKALMILIGIVYAHHAYTQVYLSKYVGNLPADNTGHYFEIFNESNQTADISNYLVVTRHYILQLSSNTYLKPLERLRIGASVKESTDISFNALESMKFREVGGNDPGDFMVLMDKSLTIKDASLFSVVREVDFLPYKEELMLGNSSALIISLPSENDRIWNFLPAQDDPDPALAYLRINDEWKISSRTKNMLPAVSIIDINTTFENGKVIVKWLSEFEQDCFSYIVERSEDGNNYKQIGTVPSMINQRLQTYQFEDANIQPDKRYYYQIRNTDKFGFNIYSDYSLIRTGETNDQFDMQIIRIGQTLNIRFASSESQRIRIKIMDEEYREVDILFYDIVEAYKDNLIEYLKELSVGKYFLIAQTERQRIYKEILITE